MEVLLLFVILLDDHIELSKWKSVKVQFVFLAHCSRRIKIETIALELISPICPPMTIFCKPEAAEEELKSHLWVEVSPTRRKSSQILDSAV